MKAEEIGTDRQGLAVQTQYVVDVADHVSHTVAVSHERCCSAT